MPYVARRKLRLNGRVYQASEPIPEDELPNVSKLGSLIRVGYLVQQDTQVGQASVSAPPSEVVDPPIDTLEAQALPDPGEADLSGLKIAKLRSLAKEQGIPTSGTKKDLIQRLQAAS
jgi:hypothetical protein